MDLEKIIKNSSFVIHEGIFIYTKVKDFPGENIHFMVSSDRDEITVVTERTNLEKLNIIERNKDNYKLIELKVAIPFYSVGFLASVSKAIADEGINILIVSTYSKDYIMVKEDDMQRASDALLGIGLKKE